MSKYISARYIQEKMRPIQNLIRTVEQECSVGESDNIADKIPEKSAKRICICLRNYCKRARRKYSRCLIKLFTFSSLHVIM